MRYTIEQIRSMTTVEELDAVVAEIRKHKDDADADITQLNQMMDAVEERRAAMRAAEEARRALADRVSAGEAGRTIRGLDGQSRPAVYSNESPEYRTGFLRLMMDQELSREERAAVEYVATTGDTTNGAANVLPRTMLNSIWDLIEEQHSILGDINLYRTGTILEIAVRTEITQGDAKSVAENAANDDEINKFVKVTLSGKDFSKHVDISYAMAKMSLDAFEAFLTKEIADRIGAALAADVVTSIGADIATDNKVTSAASGEIAFKDVASAMAKLKNALGQAVVYGSRATIYAQLVGMVDTAKRPIFQLNAQEGAEGYLIGCPVKVEDSIADGKLLIGYPKQVVGNMVQDIMVESDKDIKKHVITYAGYARFESKLVASQAFVELSVKA